MKYEFYALGVKPLILQRGSRPPTLGHTTLIRAKGFSALDGWNFVLEPDEHLAGIGNPVELSRYSSSRRWNISLNRFNHNSVCARQNEATSECVSQVLTTKILEQIVDVYKEVRGAYEKQLGKNKMNLKLIFISFVDPTGESGQNLYSRAIINALASHENVSLHVVCPIPEKSIPKELAYKCSSFTY